MKTKLISSKPAATNEIDWGKRALYIGVNSVIVLSNGVHDGPVFSGVVILGTDVGYYCDSWPKSVFTPITEPITIQFNCDEQD